MKNATLFIANFFLLISAFGSQITGISIAPNSQSPLSRPAIDGVYSVYAPVDVNLGIGIIVNPVLDTFSAAQVPLHLDSLSMAPAYINGYQPNPDFATVTYLFDAPTIVRGVEVLQHYHGATVMSGMLGDTLGSLSSLGSTSGPRGAGFNSTGPQGFNEGESNIFDFGNLSVSGTIFQATVSRTSFPDAFAVYRVYVLDENLNRIGLAPSSVSVPERLSGVWTWAILALVAYAGTKYRRRCAI